MQRFFAALLGLVLGYPVFAFAGYWAIALFSANNFDRSVEAAMTSLFVFGPLGAIIGLVAGVILGRKRPAQATPSQSSSQSG